MLLEIVGALLNEALFVVDDIWVMDWGQDSNLIQCILLFTFIQIVQLHFLYRVDLIVYQPFGLVDAGVRSLTFLNWKIPSLPKNWKSFSDIIKQL